MVGFKLYRVHQLTWEFSVQCMVSLNFANFKQLNNFAVMFNSLILYFKDAKMVDHICSILNVLNWIQLKLFPKKMSAEKRSHFLDHALCKYFRFYK